jgi:arsenate reductase
VVTPLGVRLCRPSETVLNILPAEQGGAFRKESGEPVIDDQGRRVDRGHWIEHMDAVAGSRAGLQAA